MSRSVRVALATLGSCLAACSAAQAASLTPVTNDSAGAKALASALADPGTTVGAASFVAGTPPAALTQRPNATGSAKLGAFPSQGRTTFAALTTGLPVEAEAKTTPGWISPATGTAFTYSDPTRATTSTTSANDATVLKVPVTVPATANCLTFDFQFLSSEYPTYVNSQYNDAFVAELDKTTWKLTQPSGSQVTVDAPDNFAFDAAGKAISVNTTTFSKDNAAGTGFADFGATPLLSASKVVTPGAHDLFLSIFDSGDHIYDSAVLADALRVGFVPNPAVNCKPGAQPVLYSVQATGGGTSYVDTPQAFTATVKTSAGAPVKQGKVVFTVAGPNARTETATTNDAGVATFSYAGATPGQDTISACYDNDADGTCEANDSRTTTWESRPVLTAGSPTVAEGDDGSHAVDVPVTLDKAATADVSVGYTTQDGTATAGEDYTATAGTLTIAKGATSGTISVPVLGDRLVEGDETFGVALSTPTVATLGTPATGTVTITDDDQASLSVADAAVAEDAGPATVVVTSTRTSSKPITVAYATQDGTAVAGQDYTATGGTATIPAGQTTTTITVPVTADTAVEPDEAFTVALSGPSARAAIGTGTATVTIRNDDAPAPQQGVLGVQESGQPNATVLCGQDVVLLDVVASGRKVHVAGLAAARFAGQRVTIAAGGKRVGTARVAADATFAADVPLPAKAKRSSIRYTATVGGKRSRALKLERRLVITKRKGLTISGRVRAGKGQAMPKTVTFYRQLTCTQRKQFKTVEVSKSGAFTVTLAKPAAGESYALFRVSAKLGKGQTFTLPIAVR